MRLYSYIARRFLISLLRVQIGVSVLVFLLIATEELRFLSQKDVDLQTTIWLITLKLPEMLAITFPIVMLLASLFLFLGLARTSELVIVRASGVSALKILLAPIVVSILIGVIAIALINPIVAATIRNVDLIHTQISGGKSNLLSISGDGLWLRQTTPTGQFVIQAQRSNSRGSVLYNVRFHEYTETGILMRRIEAPRAELKSGEWKLFRAVQWQFIKTNGTSEIEILEARNINLPTDLTRERILESFATPETLSIWRIPAFIEQLELSGFSAVSHKVFLHSQFSGPLMLVAMVLIGAAFSLRHARFGHTGIMALLAVLSGFLLFALKNVAESLGEAQEVPIILATWAPPAAAALFALTYLLHLEDG